MPLARIRLTLVLALFIAIPAVAQTTNATRFGPIYIDTWRVHQGDDSRWASPAFDDSRWQAVPESKHWDDVGLGAIRGYIWLRTRVQIPPKSGRLGMQLNIIGPLEIFVDGHLIGSVGQFPPGGYLYAESPKLFTFDAPAAGVLEIALRVWIWPIFDRIGRLPGPVYLGPEKPVRDIYELALRRTLDGEIPGFILDVLYLVLAAGLLVLFLLQRTQTEYLWLSLAILLSVLASISGVYQEFTGFEVRPSEYFRVFAYAASAICLLEFVFRFLREPVSRLARFYQVVLFLNVFVLVAAFQERISLADTNITSLLLHLPYWFATPLIVLWRYFRGNKEAGLLTVPLFLMFIIDMLESLRWVLWHLRLRGAEAFVPDLQFDLVTVSPDIITHFLFFLTIAAIILYRFQRVRLDQVRAHAELEAARSMQEVMVPSSVTAPGFQIECAYIPAQEVGGDFFLLESAPDTSNDGSVVIVIGDVSGKGLKAAMLVSLILGLIRRTLQETREPARILADVNHLLAGQTDGRFATCCCARIHRDGRIAIANAGHLSPYCGGIELETPGGIPLGIAADIEYEQVEFLIPPGERILFLSDGVVEARSKSGELYGFQRTGRISVEPAADIARAAQRFGQEDDITVVGIQPEPALV